MSLAAACVSCSTPSPSSPGFFIGAPTVTYSGAVTDSTRGTGTATMTLATVQGITSGNVDMTFATPETRQAISGLIAGGVYTAKFSNCGPDISCSTCEFSFTGSVSPTAVSGSYGMTIVTDRCPARTGTMTLTAR